MSSWLPVLAGGVGGAVLTNLAGEWRQWRANRREDRNRFNSERLAAASEISRLSGDARRVQLRRIALAAHTPIDRVRSTELETRYQALAEELSSTAARFRLLFPAQPRAALQTLLDDLDKVTSAVTDASDQARTALITAQASDTAFVECCRRFLVGIKDKPVAKTARQRRATLNPGSSPDA